MPSPTLLAPPNDVSSVEEHAGSATSTSTPTSRSTPGDRAVIGPIRRRSVDSVLVAAGAVVALVLGVAGGLLMWGSNFADDYVGDELAAQNVFFPDQAALEEGGRADLVQYAGEQVTTGSEAEAYASYIDGHLAEIADGATYADLGAVERAANTAVEEAQASGADEATVSGLQADADAVTGQRDSLFKGETLRGLLLSTFAWSTIGQIAGIGALVAFVAAGAMIVLVGLGIIHRRKYTTS